MELIKDLKFPSDIIRTNQEGEAAGTGTMWKDSKWRDNKEAGLFSGQNIQQVGCLMREEEEEDHLQLQPGSRASNASGRGFINPHLSA